MTVVIVLVALFGMLPAIVLAIAAVVIVIGGLAVLFEEPVYGPLFTFWGIAGIAGTRTLVQVASGTYTENTIPGLLAGIGAAAPLLYFALTITSLPGLIVSLYFTAGPIVVATGYLVQMLLFEGADDARIVEYEEA